MEPTSLYLNGSNVERLLVINGCSHSAGSEIPGAGIGDSEEGRRGSFGSLLAEKLNRKPIHLALPGGSNEWINRITLAWLGDNLYRIQNKEIDVVFLIHWTGLERFEYRFWQPFKTPFVDYKHDVMYRNFSIGTQQEFLGEDRLIFKTFCKMFVNGRGYWSDNKLKNIISLQSALKSFGCKYWFGNAFDTFESTATYSSLIKLLDPEYFPYFNNQKMCYYWYCKNLGFNNQDTTNKLWHLNGEAHRTYSDLLLTEFQKVGLDG